MREYNLKQKKRINDFLIDLTALLIKHDAEIDMEEVDRGYYATEAELCVSLAINSKDEDSESKVYDFVIANGRENIDCDDTLRKMIQ